MAYSKLALLRHVFKNNSSNIKSIKVLEKIFGNRQIICPTELQSINNPILSLLPDTIGWYYGDIIDVLGSSCAICYDITVNLNTDFRLQANEGNGFKWSVWEYIEDWEINNAGNIDSNSNGDIYFSLLKDSIYKITFTPNDNNEIQFGIFVEDQEVEGGGCREGFSTIEEALMTPVSTDLTGFFEGESVQTQIELGGGAQICYWAISYNTEMEGNYSIVVIGGDGVINMYGWDGTADSNTHTISISSEAGGASILEATYTNSGGDDPPPDDPPPDDPPV